MHRCAISLDVGRHPPGQSGDGCQAPSTFGFGPRHLHRGREHRPLTPLTVLVRHRYQKTALVDAAGHFDRRACAGRHHRVCRQLVRDEFGVGDAGEWNVDGPETLAQCRPHGRQIGHIAKRYRERRDRPDSRCLVGSALRGSDRHYVTVPVGGARQTSDRGPGSVYDGCLDRVQVTHSEYERPLDGQGV
jgi:hypothetical protein